MPECLVCLQATPKTRVHYGGVSCYSCRAFFRRNTRSGKTKKCKIDQDCAVSYMEHKQCTPCRYQKCLRSELGIIWYIEKVIFGFHCLSCLENFIKSSKLWEKHFLIVPISRHFQFCFPLFFYAETTFKQIFPFPAWMSHLLPCVM